MHEIERSDPTGSHGARRLWRRSPLAPGMPFGWLIALAAAAALVAGPALARRPKPSPCSGGRFLVDAQTRLLTPGSEPEAIVLDGRQLSLDAGCSVTAARVRAGRGGTRLRGVWKPCGTFGTVRLAARFDASCQRLDGTLRVKKRRRPFTARRSTCGDGRLDARTGEQCDPPGTPGCDARCIAVAGSTTTTTLPGPLDVWRPATVPFDPACRRGCQEIESGERLAHLGAPVRFLYDPAVDDPVAQWGDCLAAILRCLRVTRDVRGCAVQPACPAPCTTRFETLAPADADPRALFDVLAQVYVREGAPCRPAEVMP